MRGYHNQERRLLPPSKTPILSVRPALIGTFERSSLKVSPLCRETALETVANSSTRKAAVATAHPLDGLCLEV